MKYLLISFCLLNCLLATRAFASYAQTEEQLQAERDARYAQNQALSAAKYRASIAAGNERFASCHGGLASGATNSSEFATQDGWECAIGARGMGELDCANAASGKDFRISWPLNLKEEYAYTGDGQEAIRCFTAKRKRK